MVDVLSRTWSNDWHKQLAKLWTMTEELVATNPLLQHKFLANFAIYNDLVKRSENGTSWWQGAECIYRKINKYASGWWRDCSI